MPPTKIGVVSLKADTGNYLARCNNCIPRASSADSAFVHVTEADLPTSPWAKFEMWLLDSGLYAFKADSGNYLGRCNGCASGAAYPDSLFVHVPESQLLTSPWAHFQLIQIQDKFFIKGDNDLFVGRVRDGVPGAAYPDSAFVYVRMPEPVTSANITAFPAAAWTLVHQSG